MEISTNSKKKSVMDLIRFSLWHEGQACADRETFLEMKQHTVAGLAASALQEMSLPEDLKKEWGLTALMQAANYHKLLYIQESLPVTVPYVILKGTAAAQYYPVPEYRSMGDIDIMTRREDYEKACEMLLNGGWHEINCKDHSDEHRHREFVRGGAIVEVHAYFASLNDPAQAEYLDDLIIENITPSHVLPDPVNGLALLEHISQHMEHGLGLRQIIDWMMFVHRCLPDEKWPDFRAMAQNIGLEQLAKVTARMCEMYLGLPQRKWCADADEKLCASLMDYVFNCGNFGNKWENEEHRSKLITYSRTPRAALKLFREIGVQNWKAAQKYRILRPLAWLYQAGRFFLKGITQKGSIIALKAEFDEAGRRNRMFDALGIKQRSKGLAVYKDGKYVKE